METNARETLSCGVEAALRAAAAMGRVMLTTNAHGATHERIGPIGDVAAEGHLVRLSGDSHDSVIDAAKIGAVIADRTGRMKDKALPRLDFQDKSGGDLFSLICLDGLEPFDAALNPLGAGEALAEKEKPASTPAALDDGDPGAKPFTAAAASQQRVTIAVHRDGLTQRWSGLVEAVKPAMGFINVMTPNFHLHLRGGSVARWARTEENGDVVLAAESADGAPLGLRVIGPQSAFADA